MAPPRKISGRSFTGPNRQSKAWMTKNPTFLMDGWNEEHNKVFADCLTRLALKRSLKDDPTVVKEALTRVAIQMKPVFKKGISESKLRQKLDQLRARHTAFSKFRNIPGVKLNEETFKAEVDSVYWEHVDPQNEPFLFKRFHEESYFIESELDDLFEKVGVAELPDDPFGSPQCPIDLSDDESPVTNFVAGGSSSPISKLPSFHDVAYVINEDSKPDNANPSDLLELQIQAAQADLARIRDLRRNNEFDIDLEYAEYHKLEAQIAELEKEMVRVAAVQTRTWSLGDNAAVYNNELADMMDVQDSKEDQKYERGKKLAARFQRKKFAAKQLRALKIGESVPAPIPEVDSDDEPAEL